MCPRAAGLSDGSHDWPRTSEISSCVYRGWGRRCPVQRAHPTEPETCSCVSCALLQSLGVKVCWGGGGRAPLASRAGVAWRDEDPGGDESGGGPSWPSHHKAFGDVPPLPADPIGNAFLTRRPIEWRFQLLRMEKTSEIPTSPHRSPPHCAPSVLHLQGSEPPQGR